MKNKLILALCFALLGLTSWGQNAAPLRVFIRAGVKTHGPNQHDHPRFLKDWTTLLNQRGAQAQGAMDFPTAEQLAVTDVLVLFAQDGGNISPAQRAYLEPYLKRGGGLVVLHDAVCGRDAEWFKTVIGGAWEYGKAGYYEGDFAFYYQDPNHPITRGASNFDFDDEMYYDLNMMPEAHVLAAAYRPDARYKREGRNQPSVYDIVPQMWTYEKDNYRAFVCIPGHNYHTFEMPHIRAVLLRGIAWAGKRPEDSLANAEELGSLRYPEGGPTAPEKAAAKIVVPPEFNLNLVAAEPLIEKPISMDWDARGRLWVAETPEYPFRQDRTRAPQDRISILDQPDAAGRMQRKTVFYEGLDLVTSMVLYRDGVIVSQAPHIILLRDTKGTGKADERTVLYTGFGTNDTHAVISNLRWGMDGWIYATLGYTRGNIYSGDRAKHFGTLSEGVIRFRPDGSAIEQFSSKGSNTWGVDTAPDGEIFFSQANGNHIDHVVMPESALAKGRVGRTTSFQNIEDHNRSFPLMDWKKQAYVQIDWVGNFTAAAGACIYDGGAWPAKYDYTFYVTEPTINLVHQDNLTPRGVSFVASKDAQFEGKEFVAGTDLWFRPIHTRVGPDGALYILDFYNQAAVHNDTRGPRHDPKSNAAVRPDRDHYFGRIWRMQHKQARVTDVPNLATADAAGLVAALNHPNMWVRLTAQRRLVETGQKDAAPALRALAQSGSATAFAKIHALWTLQGLGLLAAGEGQAALVAALGSPDPIVAKNAFQITTAQPAASPAPIETAAVGRLQDANPRVRLGALVALQNLPASPALAQAVVRAYPTFADAWLESAAVGVAAKAPTVFLTAALDAPATGNGTLVGQLATQIAREGDPAAVAGLVSLLAAKPANADGLKQVILTTLSRDYPNSAAAPAWTPELQKAFQILLGAPNRSLGVALLPLLSRWDQAGTLAGDTKTLVARLKEQLNDANLPDGQRAEAAVSLLSVRKLDAEILPLVAAIPGSANAPALQRTVIEALGKVSDPLVGAELVKAYAKAPTELQDVILNELFKRSDWTLALLDGVKSGTVSLGGLGPVAIGRLRTYSDLAVAKRANALIDELKGPEMKEKDALIAQFTPQVTQPGDVVKGRALFTQNCAICHKFNGQGKDVAPDLSGMGVHGPAELIIHVLDPNREVEPNYVAWSVETKDGETYDGVIARENRTSVTLRNSVGEKEIPTSEIKRRRNTGLSLMPNGFEALGAAGLRDILTYLCAGETRYRVIDLRPAFTTSTTRGLFYGVEIKDETLAFRKFGLFKVGEVPFEVVNPQKVAGGNNLMVLKGGEGVAKTMPQKVAVKNLNLTAARLHFLGGVGGWAYPCCGNDNHQGLLVAKVTVQYADGQTELLELLNGREFADYNGEMDVPGSKAAPNLVSRGQVRTFTKNLRHKGTITGLTFESFDNFVAPVFVAVTADSEAGGAPSAAAAPAVPAATPAPAEPLVWGPGAHVLTVGGNSSHDFNRWFKAADSATLAKDGLASVHYTDRLAEVLPALPNLDVLYLSCNQPLNDQALRQAIFAFADAGHGLLLVHPALWRNWRDWPQYNRILVGGGATSHDAYGEFEVTVTAPGHPLLKGVPATFRLKDELYHFVADADGSPRTVLAEGRNLATGKTYPVLWITQHPKAKIVCCTLGHDAAAHDLPAYQAILRNSVAWMSEK